MILTIKYMKDIKYIMVKTIRLKHDNLHKKLLQIQGAIQYKSGETTTMDDVIEKLIELYEKKNKK